MMGKRSFYKVVFGEVRYRNVSSQYGPPYGWYSTIEKAVYAREQDLKRRMKEDAKEIKANKKLVGKKKK